MGYYQSFDATGWVPKRRIGGQRTLAHFGQKTPFEHNFVSRFVPPRFPALDLDFDLPNFDVGLDLKDFPLLLKRRKKGKGLARL